MLHILYILHIYNVKLGVLDRLKTYEDATHSLVFKYILRTMN